MDDAQTQVVQRGAPSRRSHEGHALFVLYITRAIATHHIDNESLLPQRGTRTFFEKRALGLRSIAAHTSLGLGGVFCGSAPHSESGHRGKHAPSSKSRSGSGRGGGRRRSL